MIPPRASQNTDLVARAREFATRSRQRINERRRNPNRAREVHLKAVAELVAGVTDDEEMVAAAWLHDIVEDSPATLDEVEREFGAGVSLLVAEITGPSRPGHGDRAQRKALDRRHFAQASPRAKTVKLAELVDNCEELRRHDEALKRILAVETAALLDVLAEGDERLVERARRTLAKCTEKLPAAEPDGSMEGLPELSEVDLELATRHQHSVRLFMRAFSAEDIAEPLPSFDADTDAKTVKQTLARRGSNVAGVRVDGLVKGYVRPEGLGQGACLEALRPFKDGQVLRNEASLSDVVHVLTRHDHCFVCILGSVTGIIGRGDMQKPAVRMWLFGIITLSEKHMRDRILARWPNEEWTERLSPGRLEKAKHLRRERRRRGVECLLLDCVQVADQAQILMTMPEERLAFGFESKGAAREVIRQFQSLRNNLAHAQDIVSYDWAQIARMSQRMDALARGL